MHCIHHHFNNASSILCFVINAIGTIEKFVSFCPSECIGCIQFCKHVVIVSSHNIISCMISTISATARQILVVSTPWYAFLPSNNYAIKLITIIVILCSGDKVYCTNSISTKLVCFSIIVLSLYF